MTLEGHLKTPSGSGCASDGARLSLFLPVKSSSEGNQPVLGDAFQNHPQASAPEKEKSTGEACPWDLPPGVPTLQWGPFLLLSHTAVAGLWPGSRVRVPTVVWFSSWDLLGQQGGTVPSCQAASMKWHMQGWRLLRAVSVPAPATSRTDINPSPSYGGPGWATPHDGPQHPGLLSSLLTPHAHLTSPLASLGIRSLSLPMGGQNGGGAGHKCHCGRVVQRPSWPRQGSVIQNCPPPAQNQEGRCSGDLDCPEPPASAAPSHQAAAGLLVICTDAY